MKACEEASQKVLPSPELVLLQLLSLLEKDKILVDGVPMGFCTISLSS